MDRSENEEQLQDLEIKLKCDENWKVTSLVLCAKVPVLKAVYIPQNLKCEFIELL